MCIDPWDADRRPPCWPVGQSCPNPCAMAHYSHVVHNHVDLAGPWAGWRLAGRDLVGPGRGRDAVRISVDRLRGLLWREAAEARLRAAQAKSGHRDGVIELPQRSR